MRSTIRALAVAATLATALLACDPPPRHADVSAQRRDAVAITPVLLEPFDLAHLPASPARLSVSARGGAAQTVKIEWSRNAAFTSGVTSVPVPGVMPGAPATVSPATLASGTWYWRASASDDSVTWVTTSTFSFTVDPLAPPAGGWLQTTQPQLNQGQPMGTRVENSGGGEVRLGFEPATWSEDFETSLSTWWNAPATGYPMQANGALSTAQFVDGAQSLWLNDSSTLSGGGVSVLSKDLSALVPDAGRLTFHLRTDHDLTKLWVLDLQGQTLKDLVGVGVQDGGVVWRTASGWNRGPLLTTNEWHRFDVDIDRVHQRYGVSVDGTVLAFNVPWIQTRNGRVQRILIDNSGDDVAEGLGNGSYAWAMTGDSYWDAVSIRPVLGSGAFASPAVDASAIPATSPGWGELHFDASQVEGAVKVHVQSFTGATWQNVSDTDLPGNLSGFTVSPVSLANLSTTTYAQLRLVADFGWGSGAGPVLRDWGISFAPPVGTGRLVFTNPVRTVEAGACSLQLFLQLQDGSATPVPAPAPLTVALASSSSTTQFFSDASCTNRVTSVTIAQSSAWAGLYAKDTLVGVRALTASAPMFGTAMQNLNVDPGQAAKLLFLDPTQPLAVNACSPPLRVQLADAFDNPVPLGGTAVVFDSPGGVLSFFSDACTTPATTVSTGNSGVATAHFTSPQVGFVDVNVEANVSGTISGSQTWSLTGLSATKLALLADPPTIAAGGPGTTLTATAVNAVFTTDPNFTGDFKLEQLSGPPGQLSPGPTQASNGGSASWTFSSDVVGTAVFEVTGQNLTPGQALVVVRAGPADSVWATGPLQAPVKTQAPVTLQLRDARGNAATQALPVQLTVYPPTCTVTPPGPVTTADTTGQATVQLQCDAPTTAGVCGALATQGKQGDCATVQFVAPPSDGAATFVLVAPQPAPTKAGAEVQLRATVMATTATLPSPRLALGSDHFTVLGVEQGGAPLPQEAGRFVLPDLAAGAALPLVVHGRLERGNAAAVGGRIETVQGQKLSNDAVLTFPLDPPVVDLSCGCHGAGGAASLWWALALLPVLRRRHGAGG